MNSNPIFGFSEEEAIQQMLYEIELPRNEIDFQGVELPIVFEGKKGQEIPNLLPPTSSRTERSQPT